VRKKYRNDYPSSWKVFFLGWASCFYSFLPFRQKLRPILLKLRASTIGSSAYEKK